MITYTVNKGDTLSAIAKRFSTTVNAIATANNISNPNKIVVGQKIRIPDSKNYHEIGALLAECLDDIGSLASFKKIISLL